MSDRTKLERSLDEANRAYNRLLAQGEIGTPLDKARARVEKTRRALRQHRSRMEGRP